MAHTQFQQVVKLVKLIDYEGNDIYVHIDKKVKNATEIFKDIIEPVVSKSKIYFVPQNNVQWGGIAK